MSNALADLYEPWTCTEPGCGKVFTRRIGEPTDKCITHDPVAWARDLIVPPIVVLVPVRTKNPLNAQQGNSRLAGIIRARRRSNERGLAGLLVSGALKAANVRPPDLLPSVVTLTRVSTGKLDTDGLAASQKALRDAVADVLGVNDGGRFVRWRYAQRKGKRGEYGTEVRIEKGVFRKDVQRGTR